MAYVAPSVVDLKRRFPLFAEADDYAVLSAIGEGGLRAGDAWPDDDRFLGVLLYAAHVLMSDGLGSPAAVQLAGFKAITVGSLKLERDTGSGAPTAGLQSTSYGRRFAELTAANFGGPLVA